MAYKKKILNNGFTIVELLVVIVVIGILAAITIVAYTGISQKAVSASLQSDLDNASKQLKLYQVEYSSFPTTMNVSNCPTAPVDDPKYCLKFSTGNSKIGYSASNQSNPQTFYLVAGNNSINYKTTDNTAPTLLAQTQPGVTPGAVLELHAAKANTGISPGINSPFTTTWTDTSGNNNNGILTNMAGTTASGWATGPNRLVLDGVNDYVMLPYTSEFSFSSGFAVELWYRGVNAGSWNQYPFAKQDTYVIRSAQSALEQPSFFVYDASASVYQAAWSGGTINDGGWHHIVGVFEPNVKVRLYVDGIERAVSGTAPASVKLQVADITLGAWYPSYGFIRGEEPLVRLYPFYLTATQVAANYAAGTAW